MHTSSTKYDLESFGTPFKRVNVEPWLKNLLHRIKTNCISFHSVLLIMIWMKCLNSSQICASYTYIVGTCKCTCEFTCKCTSILGQWMHVQLTTNLITHTFVNLMFWGICCTSRMKDWMNFTSISLEDSVLIPKNWQSVVDRGLIFSIFSIISWAFLKRLRSPTSLWSLVWRCLKCPKREGWGGNVHHSRLKSVF